MNRQAGKQDGWASVLTRESSDSGRSPALSRCAQLLPAPRPSVQAPSIYGARLQYGGRAPGQSHRDKSGGDWPKEEVKIKINVEENKEGNKGQVQIHLDSLFFTKYDMYASTQK